MNGYIEINGERFDESTGVNLIELVEEYGFLAHVLTVNLDTDTIMYNFPEIFDATKLPISARLFVGDTVKRFEGFIDDINGAISLESTTETIQVTARSVLSLLVDDGDTITRAYVNEDWGAVVADVVKTRGFDPIHVEMSGVKAGEEDARLGHFLSLDETLPGEVVNNAVAATGFLANTTPDMGFIFKAPPSENSLVTLSMTESPTSSDIVTANFTGPDLTSIILNDESFVFDMGEGLTILIANRERLSGKYYVTRARYQTSDEGVDITEFGVVRELPDLRAT